jgi:carboxypeptidase Q
MKSIKKLTAIFSAAILTGSLLAQDSATTPPRRSANNTNDVIARIREEGLNHSQVMETLSYLSDVIGPRLTASPQMKRANEWTKSKMESWGMENAHLEAWGPFGKGWTLERFSAQVVEPQAIPLKAYPSAWSPGLKKAITAPVVFVEATNTAALDKLKGKLKGAIVLPSAVRAVPPRVDPPVRRYEATNLLAMANAEAPRAQGNSPTPLNDPAAGGRPRTNAFAGRRGGGAGWTRALPFLIEEGAAAVLIPSTQGDAGTLFVASASLPSSNTDTNSASTNNAARPRRGGRGAGASAAERPSIYSVNAPATLPQVTVAVEDYNRLVRMIQAGEKLKMALDLQVEFHTKDLMSYNTVAEIPGSDLKDEIVMLGAHMDSWHSGTGATDNGAGCAAVMEAARIIKALDLKPRRTIRVALWSGEEEGLIGSKEYVTKHFGKYVTNRVATAGDPDQTNTNRANRRELVKEKEYEKFSAYFNLDNGGGKIRGVYMQGNEAVRPLFRKWLEPFRDLGAETLTPSNTGGTDHLSFNAVGLPGFQFIQDPLDYGSRTHHSNEDVFDRIIPDDMKQAATIIAAFAYNAAMLDEKLPRKPTE